MLLPRGGKRLVGALQNALRADINPTAGGHLAVHDEAAIFQLAEIRSIRPRRHQQRVGDQYTRSIGVRAKYSNRLAGLYEQGLVIFQLAQTAHDRVITRPVARGFTAAAVHHQRRGILSHFGVEVIHQHAHGGFLHPAFAGEGIAARGANWARFG
ncbi:MAG: hypothetical protein ALAOOOJD_01746 [bacterium]|nr:hypothetical protein [bacterium]